MLPREAKSTFYLFANPFMKASGYLYRYLKAPKSGLVKVHLGPGQQNYINGWINVDANAFTGKCDVWADLRNPLPFHNFTVDAFYSHHMVEHLPNLNKHFAEVFRCLKPGGKYRVGGPNGDQAIKKFIENDLNWFSDFPDKRSSIGGRLENFIFCRGEHLTILTESYLKELMSEVGFININRCLPVKETTDQELFGDCLSLEHEEDFQNPHTLIIEGQKPEEC